MEKEIETASTTDLVGDSPEILEQPKTLRSRIYEHQFLALGIVAATILILGISLGVGLGVGLGEHPHKSSSSASADFHVTEDTAIVSNLTNGLSPGSTVWQPAVGSTWQIVLDNPIFVPFIVTPNVAVFDIDMFSNDEDTITALHDNGVNVICYFSAGTYENYRPDSSQFANSDKGKQLGGWPGEYWLNTQSQSVRKVMAARIELAASKGCDGIDADDMDGFETSTGFPLTASTALDYLTFLSTTASSYGLSIGLKNAGAIASNATSIVQYSIIESCVTGDECGYYQPFIAAGKPVFQIEYPNGAPGNVRTKTLKATCPLLKSNTGFSEIIKTRDLDGWVEFCDGTTATTPTYWD